MDIKREPPKKRGKYIAIAGGTVVLIGTTVWLGQLESRPPSVERATLIIDSVQRGNFTREVRAPGTLVPEHIRFVVAVTSGRVEALPIRPGAKVMPTTLLLELSNPDVMLEALSAQSNLSNAESNLLSLQTSLESQRLARQGTVATIRTQHNNAKRSLQTFEALNEKALASPQEMAAARDLMQELEARLKVEEQQLKLQTESINEQLRFARANVDRLRAIQVFQQQRVASMKVLAGDSGELQQLGNGQQELQLGQWVLAGSVLATVAQPGRLKALLRIPETQARDVVVGQSVKVDTHNGVVPGRVIRVDPGSQGGTVGAEVVLEGTLPTGARPDMSVDGVIEIERLQDVMFVQRPAYGQPESTVGVFKLEADGRDASRVNVLLGRASVNQIEVKSGLKVGDRVIVSDMSQWDNVSKVRLQ